MRAGHVAVGAVVVSLVVSGVALIIVARHVDPERCAACPDKAVLHRIPAVSDAANDLAGEAYEIARSERITAEKIERLRELAFGPLTVQDEREERYVRGWAVTSASSILREGTSLGEPVREKLKGIVLDAMRSDDAGQRHGSISAAESARVFDDARFVEAVRELTRDPEERVAKRAARSSLLWTAEERAARRAVAFEGE